MPGFENVKPFQPFHSINFNYVVHISLRRLSGEAWSLRVLSMDAALKC